MYSFLLFLGFGIVSQQFNFNKQEARVDGTFLCRQKPIPENTTVTIWDDAIIADDKLNATWTRKDGSFRIYGREFVFFSFKPFIAVRHRCGQRPKLCKYETRIWFPSSNYGEGVVHHLGIIQLERLRNNETVTIIEFCS
ncbi:unnamed protein product, partial [Mesorhabditis belari]|uniref:Uncharacterized protein n=1 Tax=Mesorhabditis belari TaxID=2138241 RepID=A0AAF3FR51_9BILA